MNSLTFSQSKLLLTNSVICHTNYSNGVVRRQKDFSVRKAQQLLVFLLKICECRCCTFFWTETLTNAARKKLGVSQYDAENSLFVNFCKSCTIWKDCQLKKKLHQLHFSRFPQDCAVCFLIFGEFCRVRYVVWVVTLEYYCMSTQLFC